MAGRGFSTDFFQVSRAPSVANRGRGRGMPALEADPSPREAFSSAPKRGISRRGQSLQFYHSKPPSVNSKAGSSGSLVSLSANYFRLLKKPNFKFTQYRVDFTPEIDHVGLRKRFLFDQKEILRGYLFDGQSLLYLTHTLKEDQMEFQCADREGSEYKLNIKKTNIQIELTDGMATQVLNLILKRSMDGLNMQLVGRNLYDPGNKVNLEEFKVELWPGYITSIRQHEENVLVCCEVSHKVMRMETIYDILRNLKNDSKGNWKEDFKKEILSSIVLTSYNNRTYRVDDVDFGVTPKSTFMKGGQEMSFKEYYENKYKLKIRDENQPMLVSKPKVSDVRDGRCEHLLLVPELCRATGLTDKMRANFRMMKEMAAHTQMDPVNRKKRLLEFTKRLQNSEVSKNCMESFNTNIDEELVTFQGRALDQEKMIFGNDVTVLNKATVDWTNPMKMNPMYTSVPLKRWFFIYPLKTSKESEEFLKLMMEVAKGLNYEMTEPKKIGMPDDRASSYVSLLQESLQKDPKMIVCVVPNNAGDRYAAIKKTTCVDRAVPTQVLMSKTMIPKKGNVAAVKSIATKVVVQINCKLGGAPWMIQFPLKGVMTIGFDVTHDTRDRSKSFGAFVASMDLKSSAEFFSAASSHKDGNEMSTNIRAHLIQALGVYKKRHDESLPEQIFFYRDGVSDGQVEYIYQNEVEKMSKDLVDTYKRFGSDKAAPKLTFIVVNKRINTRIFKNQGNQVANPDPGTIVDTTITLPERYDFYLVSQSVRQGTVAPTSYNIIFDQSLLAPDKIQRLTYKMTHLYYNWSGCVRVPAVVQYAHKLALLAGEHLHQAPSTSFMNQLYYL